MSGVGSAQSRAVHSASSSASRTSEVNHAISRPSTSFKLAEQHSSAPSRMSGARSGNRMLFTDLLSSRNTSSFAPTKKEPAPKPAAGSRMIFTGPDQAESHRVIIGDRGKYVGFRPMSTEVTSDSEYLYRPCQGNQPAMLMRHQRVGEIGWNVPKLWRIKELGK